MVNGNQFRLTIKAYLMFGKRFMLLKIVNRFSEFKLFILVCMFVGIRHCEALKFVGNPNLPPKVLEF